MDFEVSLDQAVRQHTAELPSKMRFSNWPENSLIFMCKFYPGPGPPKSYCDNSLEVMVPDVTVTLAAQCSVYHLRLRICMQAQEQKKHPQPLAILDPEKYILLYAKGGDFYEIYDDCQVIKTLDIPWFRDSEGHLTAKIVVTTPLVDNSGQRSKQKQSLVYLIGHDLEKDTSDRLGELNFTRRKMAFLRRQELKNRNVKWYATEPWTTSTPLPKDLQDYLERKFNVTLTFLNQISFTTKVDLNTTPYILLKVFQRVMADQGCSTYDSDVVLRVTGREEFLSGEFPLRDFLWVRQCLKNNIELHLSVVPLAQLAQDAVKVADWPFVDGFTGQSSSHEDLRLEGKDLDDIVLISLWDCNRCFRVKLLGFDIPIMPSKAPQSVYVEVSILYGNNVLSSVCSTAKAFTDEVLWNEWLEFDFLLSELPRGAKLGLTVIASGNENTPASKDTKTSSPTVNKTPEYQFKMKGKVLYFVNLLLIDHRSLLSQGPHTLHMWPYQELEEEIFTYQAAKKLSTSTNPDTAQSMAISIFLDRYSFPVVHPNGMTSSGTHMPPSTPSQLTSYSQTSPAVSWQHSSSGPCGPSTDLSSSPDSIHISSTTTNQSTPSCLSTVHSPSPDEECSPSVIQSPSLPPKRLYLSCNTASPLLSTGECFSPRRSFVLNDYASSLPQFLRTINWLKRNAVEDVHWLVDQCNDPSVLDLSVALELLSVDFADEHVRRLAVQRLESLSNDEVLKYLLQLVQTLKVEPYHDSFLARYLIQRALRSKRIGHFFFWYVRSEVDGCAHFRQRMAVVLEAYLLGCGQAMMDCFSQQVQAVVALQEVACEIKKMFPDKTDLPPNTALMLQSLLEQSNIPGEFLVPFDPRIKVGRILLDRCKVMASKKKPLWLEFCPMISPTPVSPVGIIFKQGDDLRQDMLVLQTLVVMDSIWQEKSLDLNLVPYGCISTGYNTGMIEIVRDAVTIAAVQRSHGGASTGAFTNDALYEWLKSKGPLQEIHYRAMERFVNSCAGYCVATYVLGIGDRHNDNIMITEQGNLFHIDFGHILGNRKRFLGVKRERVPFVLTPDFLYVMGKVKDRTSLYFHRFRDNCMLAYLSLRSHSRLLVTLFSLMLLTGIPELSAAEDMRYLRETLQQERSEAEAREHFLQQIAVCEQQGWTVQANWWFHMVAGIKCL